MSEENDHWKQKSTIAKIFWMLIFSRQKPLLRDQSRPRMGPGRIRRLTKCGCPVLLLSKQPIPVELLPVPRVTGTMSDKKLGTTQWPPETFSEQQNRFLGMALLCLLPFFLWLRSLLSVHITYNWPRGNFCLTSPPPFSWRIFTTQMSLWNTQRIQHLNCLKWLSHAASKWKQSSEGTWGRRSLSEIAANCSRERHCATNIHITRCNCCNRWFP